MMTDAMNLQQRNVEYERQRHLANWLIESSPHMPKASPQYQQQQNKKQKKLFTTSIFHDSFFFLSKSQSTAQQPPQIAQTPPQTLNEQISTNNISNSKTPVFTSQTNLPLQIVQSSRDGNKPKLRRFNSHDTSANMFSVAEFENARLARRNELELVRQKNRYKMNSLSSGCDSSTGDSKGSKFSNEVIAEESKPELLISDTFLDRFTLPRIARLIAPKSFYEVHHQQQQSQSNSLLSKKKSNQYAPQLPSPQSTNSTGDDCSTNGELFLLYKHLKNYKIYHAVNAKNGTNRKKGIKIPQDFTGYFSLINEKGSTATLYTTLIQLVRERVYKFLSVDNMQAYTESTSTDNNGSKSHYVKITAKAGQVFRLLAVFEDGGQEGKSHYPSKKENLNSIGREKEKGRYVQLLSETRQIIYVALSTKGKFYEIEQSNHQLFPKGGSNGRAPKQLNADCVHRISSIITDETVFPIHLKYISKMNGNAFNANIPENIRVTKVSIENSVIACPIDETEFCNPLHLIKIHLQPDFKFIKCFLGFESEKVMFTNQNVQNLLKFCQFNCENFVRALDYELLPKNDELMKSTDNLNVSIYNPGKIKSKSSAFSKFFSSDKHSSAHEKEDSIIFLSKNDLENLENQKQMQNDPNKPQSSVNMKKGWFKNLRNTNTNTNVSSNSNKSGGSIVNLSLNKSQSMDRYQDMSKLIQERFGNISVNGDPESAIPHHSSTMKSSSEISYDLNETTNKSMQKCFSLQNIELNNSTDMSLQQPDLVKLNHTRLNNLTNITDDDKIERDSSYTTAHHGYSSNESTLNSITEDAMVTKQQSFITEKLFNEFYVKTKQYSKSSSSLHQLLHFSVPQKMNIREMRKNAKLRAEENSAKFRLLEEKREASALAQLQLPPPPQEELMEDCVLEETNDEDTDSILIDDELPYCSVRDSIVVAPGEDKHVELETPTENIYAEICQSSATPSPSESSTNHMNQVSHVASNKPKNVSSIKISFSNDVYMQ